MSEPTVSQKTCFECHAVKPAVSFYTHPTHKDGLSSRCRSCTAIDMNRRWRAQHPEPGPYVPPTEKPCTLCEEVKPIGDFYRHKGTRDGHQTWCKLCSNATVAAARRADLPRHAAYNRKWNQKNPDRIADIALKTRLGLSHGTYAAMLDAQQGKCAICGDTNAGARTKRFHVDHDKTTDNIRGLLCSRCNTGIGQLRHSETILLAAIKYLRERS